MYVTAKEVVMGNKLTGDQCRAFARKLAEVGRQVGQEEYPYNPCHALKALQDVVEGKFLPDNNIREHLLEYGHNVIRRYVSEGGYLGYCNPAIDDNMYPVSGEGNVNVTFELIPGEKLKRADGWVYRSDFMAYCQKNGLRVPNVAEALLPPAKDRYLGRGEHPMIAIIGAYDTFTVMEYDHGRAICLSHNYGELLPHNMFLAVRK